MLKNVFLTNRFFYFCGGIIFLFVLGFSWHFMVYIAFFSALALIIASCYLVAKLHRVNSLVEVTRKLPKHFSMFDDNPVRLKIKNNSELNLNFRIIDEIPIQFQIRDLNFNIQVNAIDNHNIQYQLKPLKRGEYHFEKVHLFISESLGLVEYRKSFDIPEMVKVYPSFIQMQMYELMVFSADRNHPGIRKIRKIGHGYEFSDIRHYVAGDDPRTINWKATGRSNQLMVNNFQDEKSQQVYAVINNSRVMRMPFEGLSLMDYAINSTLSILNIVMKNQDHGGLITFAKEVDTFIPARNKNHQQQLVMDALYNQVESKQEGNYQGLFKFIKQTIKGRSLLFMFTNFMSLNAVKQALPELKRINRSHLLVVVIFENYELEDFSKKSVKTVSDIASKTMAEKLSYELVEASYELRNAGIQIIRTTPQDLTVNSINKYLELKSRGMI